MSNEENHSNDLSDEVSAERIAQLERACLAGWAPMNLTAWEMLWFIRRIRGLNARLEDELARMSEFASAIGCLRAACWEMEGLPPNQQSRQPADMSLWAAAKLRSLKTELAQAGGEDRRPEGGRAESSRLSGRTHEGGRLWPHGASS